MFTPRTQSNSSKDAKEIGKTESRSPIKVVLKILIIGITIACLVTAAIVAIQLSASAKKQADGTSDSDARGQSSTTTFIPTGRTTVRTTTTANNPVTLPNMIITYQYEEGAEAYLNCPNDKLITILSASFSAFSCMNCNCTSCSCSSMIITTTMGLRCTNRFACQFTVNQASLFSSCFVSPRTLIVTYDCR